MTPNCQSEVAVLFIQQNVMDITDFYSPTVLF